MKEFDAKAGEQYALLINGMGGTPLMEQYVFANDVANYLDEHDLLVKFHKLGNYMTSIEMQGLSLTLVKLTDADWLEALNAPVETIAW